MPFIGQEPLTGAYHVLDAITASATATYNLQLNSGAFSPATANQLLVSLNGVIQKPGSSFTISGSQITFSSALSSSDSIDFIIALGDVLNVGTPTDGSVNTSQLANDGVTTAKILDANVTSAKIANNAVTSAKMFSSFKNGVTEVDFWRMTANTTTADNRSTGIFTNWVRADSNSYFGTGMTESSGVFTFPSSGIWEIQHFARFTTTGTDARHLGVGMLVSTDSGSNYSNSDHDDVTGFIYHISANTYQTLGFTAIFDVANASTYRVKFFGRSSDSSGLTAQGSTSTNNTWVKFIRLGDT